MKTVQLMAKTDQKGRYREPLAACVVDCTLLLDATPVEKAKALPVFLFVAQHDQESPEKKPRLNTQGK